MASSTHRFTIGGRKLTKGERAVIAHDEHVRDRMIRAMSQGKRDIFFLVLQRAPHVWSSTDRGRIIVGCRRCDAFERWEFKLSVHVDATMVDDMFWWHRLFFDEHAGCRDRSTHLKEGNQLDEHA